MIDSVSATNEATNFVVPHKSHICQSIIELAHCGQVIGP
jgi:hypothetical protein